MILRMIKRFPEKKIRVLRTDKDGGDYLVAGEFI